MSIDDVTRKFYALAWNDGDLDAARTLLAADLVDHDAVEFPGREPGAQGLLQVVAMVRAGISGLEREIEFDVVAEDLVTTRFVDRGVHTGPLFGVPATGRAVAVAGINIVRVQHGRIAEIWHVEDIAGLMAQLGATGN